ncbi:hypothetical protein [Vibrio sp. CJQ_6]|uniref:hypothetical protein n=1 Tax=Vibrio sp. CJQ_6 TaxID=3367165 RepID=UPI00370C2AD0
MHSSFRSKDNDPVDALDQLAIDGLWSVAEYAKPNLGKTLLNAILSNVPTPIPVYGIMSALKDGANKIDLAHDNGWSFFIQGAEAFIRKSPNKAFKSDSQRLAVSLRSSIAKRCSHLNAALYFV